MSQVSSAADLTASLRRTSGTRPPPLVGCSVTLLGDNLYVFGGRLVPTRTMVSTLYKLDLESLEWSILSSSSLPPTSDGSTGVVEENGNGKKEQGRDPPRARYFHSCCPWGESKLVIFGGEGYNDDDSTSSSTTTQGEEGSASSSSAAPPALQTLDDLHVYDTEKGVWEEIGEVRLGDGVEEKPSPRYAHLGVVCTAWDGAGEFEGQGEEDGSIEKGTRGGGGKGKSRLMIMGGQDIKNTYLHTTDILDLDSMTWIQTGKWDRHIGTYRAIATTSNVTVKPGTLVSPNTSNSAIVTRLGNEEGGGEGLESLSWTERNQMKELEPILLFSNFNFTQVRRDLDLLSSPLSEPPSTRLSPLSLSNSMTGQTLPPGLRFPSGFQLGNHLIIFGTFLSQHVNNFSIWSLDLGKTGAGGIKEEVVRNGGGVGEALEWMRVDPGNVLQKGSWNRAVGWKNNVVVLGDRERDIAADYDHRQTNFTHVAFVDLEAHGIYQPPPRPLPPIAQSFGLLNLSQPCLSDFEIVCSDGKRLACSRKILEDRWSWFHSKILEFRVRASGVVAAQQKRAQDASLENSEAGSLKSSPAIDGASEPARSTTTTSTDSEARLTPRTLNLPEHSTVVLAFLQYLYTLTLCTRLQLSLPVLSNLLTFSRTYREENLTSMCVHALHETLMKDQSTAPAIYEAATLASCTALQVRALKSLMAVPARGGGAAVRGGQRGGGSSQQLAPEPMARQASQDVRGSTRPSNPSTSHSGSTLRGSAPTRNYQLTIDSHHPLVSSPPAPPSPPPSSTLPLTPARTVSQRNGTRESFSSRPARFSFDRTPSRIVEAPEEEEGGDTGNENDAELDALVSRPASPIRSDEMGSSNGLSSAGSEGCRDGDASAPLKKLNFRPSINGRKDTGKVKATEREASSTTIKEGGVWPPVFLDSARTAGRAVTGPLSTRKATPIKLEYLALLEEESGRGSFARSILSSPIAPLLVTDAPSRQVPPSVDIIASSRSEIALSADSRQPRRGSFDQTSELTTPVSSTIKSSAASRLSHRSSLSFSTSNPQSVSMDRKPSSSSARSDSVSSQEGSELVTPPMPSTGRFEPDVVFVEGDEANKGPSSLVSSPSPSPFNRFPRFFRGSKKSLVDGPQCPSPLDTIDLSTTTPPRRPSISLLPRPDTSPGLPPSSNPSRLTETKRDRRRIEVEVGTKLLRASGASEKEISLRARSVGFQVLQAREAGKELPSSLFEQDTSRTRSHNDVRLEDSLAT